MGILWPQLSKDVAIRSAAVRINDMWILIVTAALQIVVGGFLIRTAVKIVTAAPYFLLLFYSLLGVVKYSIELAF